MRGRAVQLYFHWPQTSWFQVGEKKCCPRCGTDSNFGPNAARHDGLQVYCRPCHQIKQKECLINRRTRGVNKLIAEAGEDYSKWDEILRKQNLAAYRGGSRLVYGYEENSTWERE